MKKSAALGIRPATANERLALNCGGDVVLQLKSPYRDGATHIVMSPLEFTPPLRALLDCGLVLLVLSISVDAPAADSAALQRYYSPAPASRPQ